MKLIAKMMGVFDDLPDFMLWMLVGVCGLMVAFWLGDVNASYRTTLEYRDKLHDLRTQISGMERAHKHAITQLKAEHSITYDKLALEYAAYAKTAIKVTTIIKRIPTYVTQTADRQCTIPAGFVYVHNAALAPEGGPVPDRAPGDVDAPSGVALSAVADTTAHNNAECVARGRIIDLWQKWYAASKDSHERAAAIMQGAAL